MDYPKTEDEDITGNILSDDGDYARLIYTSRNGITFDNFMQLSAQSLFTIGEWSKYLHISPRTMQRYKKEKKRFGALYAEKIIGIFLLQNKGVSVFGNKNSFAQWMNAENIALGGAKPKDLLDTAFGIAMIREELGRIEHGIAP